MNTKLTFVTLVVIAITLSCQVFAAPAEEIAKRCDQCHGDNGHSTEPDVPSIHGFSEFAIADLFETYRSGGREADLRKLDDGTETSMNEIAKEISDEDLEAIGQYYAKQPWADQVQDFDAKKASRGGQIHDLKCDKCHSERGTVADDDLSILAGQWREYLQQQFADFDSGKRPLPEKMKEKYDTLTAEDKSALLELYVSGGG